MASKPDTPSGASSQAKVSDVVNSFRPCRRFRPDAGSQASITSLDFDASGELALVTRDDDTLQVYNVQEGKHAKELKSQKYGAALAKYTHDSQSVIYASTKVDDGIRYLSTHDNSYIRYFHGHKAPVTCLSLCPMSTADTFLSCSLDDTVKFWNLKSQHAQGELKLHGCWFGAYDPSATVIAVASPPTGSLLLYDVRNYDKAPFATFEIPSKIHTNWGEVQRGDITRLEFSNDGKNILLATSGPGHIVLDAFDGSLNHYLSRPGGHSGRHPPNQTSLGTKVPSSGTGDACLSPDGRFAIGGSSHDGLLVWDLHSPSSHDKVLQPRAELPGSGKATIVGYNHRLNLLCSADRDFMIWLPDPESVP